MVIVEIVRIPNRDWPKDPNVWWDHVERLGTVNYEDLFGEILRGVSSGCLQGRQLDWGATVAYLTPTEMLEMMGPVPPEREGEPFWEGMRRSTREQIANLPSGD